MPTQIAMTSIEPDKDNLRMLTNDNTIYRIRQDPEYFITAEGAFIYYNRYIPKIDNLPVISEGVWRVDTKLGSPNSTEPVYGDE